MTRQASPSRGEQPWHDWTAASRRPRSPPRPRFPPRGRRLRAAGRRAALAAAVLLAVAAAHFAADGEASARAVAADPELARLLRAMAFLKASMAAAAVWLADRLLREPLPTALAAGLVLAVALMAAAPVLMWHVAPVGTGACCSTPAWCCCSCSAGARRRRGWPGGAAPAGFEASAGPNSTAAARGLYPDPMRKRPERPPAPPRAEANTPTRRGALLGGSAGLAAAGASLAAPALAQPQQPALRWRPHLLLPALARRHLRRLRGLLPRRRRADGRPLPDPRLLRRRGRAAAPGAGRGAEAAAWSAPTPPRSSTPARTRPSPSAPACPSASTPASRTPGCTRAAAST
jgi:hypothetical protein